MTILRRFLARLALPVLAVLLLAHVPQPVAAQDNPYARLYAALEAGVDQAAMIDQVVGQVMLQMMQSNPVLQQAEKDHPGFLAAMTQETRPIILRYSERVRLAYRPRMIAAAAEILTAEEAAATAAFYESPLGRRVMASASNNFSAANVAEQVAEGGEVSTDAVRRDMTETGRQSFNALTEADRTAVIRAALTVPGLAKMGTLTQHIAPIRAEMEAAPPTAQENDQIIAAVRKVAERFGVI